MDLWQSIWDHNLAQSNALLEESEQHYTFASNYKVAIPAVRWHEW